MLKTPYLNRYTNDLLIQFNNDLIYLLESAGPENIDIRQQFDDLKAGNALMEEAHKQVRGSTITNKLKGEDNIRDTLLDGIEDIVTGYTKFLDESFEDAADLIMRHLKKYPKPIAELKYQEETAAVNDLIDRAENEIKFKAAVQKLGLTDWFTKLKESNNRFQDKFRDRLDEKAGKPNLNMQELRKDSVMHFKEFDRHFSAFALVRAAELFDKIAVAVNQLIDKYNSMLRSSGKNTDNGSDEPNGEDRQ